MKETTRILAGMVLIAAVMVGTMMYVAPNQQAEVWAASFPLDLAPEKGSAVCNEAGQCYLSLYVDPTELCGEPTSCQRFVAKVALEKFSFYLNTEGWRATNWRFETDSYLIRGVWFEKELPHPLTTP